MRVRSSRERVARLAERQAGNVARHQLKHIGLGRGTIQRWIATGYLVPTLRGVYRVGHAAPSREADLWAAVLYARPGAALSHGTAAHWRGLINFEPTRIHISTSHRVESLPGIRVHGRRAAPRVLHKGIPTTSIPQTMLDLAATHKHNVVRHALAQLDFDDDLHISELVDITDHGKPGSVKLKCAIAAHQPKLALVNGKLEFDWLIWLEERGIEPLPEYRQYVCGYQVDCYWPAHGLVVELDGIRNHSSPAQMKTDRQRDFALRSHKLIVYRYDWDLVHDQPDPIEREIRRTLAEREGWNLPGTRPG
jgi:Protein of unknown function (DUF559)